MTVADHARAVLEHSDEEFAKGDEKQGSEKLWGAAAAYKSNVNFNSKVLDFVQFGGLKGMVGGTIFEMWLGGSVILGTAILAGSSSLFRWAVNSELPKVC